MPDLRSLMSRRRFLTLGAATGAAVVTGAVLGAGTVGASNQRRMSTAHLASDASPQFRAVSDVVERAISMTDVPGAALAVYANGREEIATFGVADLKSRQPVMETTLFQHGSLSKTYTATAAMRLREEGRLNIDAPVRAYLPELRLQDEYVAEHVTVRHLLTHSGGWWGDAFVETGDESDALARFVGEQLPRLPQVSPLGRYISYNNAGMSLLGRVIESITGRPYRQAMQELVLGPLGQNATYDPRVALKRSHATGHGMRDGEIVEAAPQLLPRPADPAGGLWTDVRDQIRYAQFHLGETLKDGKAPLDRAAIREMHASLMTMPEAKLDVGWSWWREQENGVRFIRHNGDTFGQMASLVLAPERGFGFTILLNSTSGEGVRRMAEQEALKQYLGVDSATHAYKAASVPESQLREYEGRYEVPTTVARVAVRGGTLMFKHEITAWPGQIQPNIPLQLPERPLAFVGDDYAVLGSAEQPLLPVSFLRKDDGSVGWLSIADRVFPKA